jgi:4-hydroxy-tetrahydrodipicolinate reductase
MVAIRVVVAGALGRMGQETARAIARDGDLALVAGVVRARPSDTAAWPYSAPLYDDLTHALAATAPDVLVDFTTAEAAPRHALSAIEAGVRPVIGTTGLRPETLAELAERCAARRIGGLVAPNFAVGAVLMMQFARLAAPYFEYAEIVELHHERKADAPSGTAVATARGMLERRGRDFQRTVATTETVPGARGAELGGIGLHAVRLAGLVAHQEVLLGTLGQTLTIRHDTTSREAFMPGVLLAIKRVVSLDRLVVGLEHLLELRLA